VKTSDIISAWRKILKGEVVHQFQFPQPRFSIPACGIMVAVGQSQPTSEQLRREIEELRAAAVELLERAATLIAESAELEKQVSRLENRNQSRKS
jgi:hypothetical protein